MGLPYADDDDEMTEEEQAAKDHALGRDLPQIITAPGKYITRAGDLAVIDFIRDPNMHDYNCMGYLVVLTTGFQLKEVRSSNWTASGRWHAGGEHENDIVK